MGLRPFEIVLGTFCFSSCNADGPQTRDPPSREPPPPPQGGRNALKSGGSTIAAGPLNVRRQNSSDASQKRLAYRGQGVDGPLLSAVINVINEPASISAAGQAVTTRKETFRKTANPWTLPKAPGSQGLRLVAPAAGRNQAGDGGPATPRPQKGFVNPPVVARLDRALSDGRGSARPSRRVPVWPTRHPRPPRRCRQR